MSNKKNKIMYWVSTGLLSALMIFSAVMYVFNHDMVGETFTRLGFPTYVIYPLAAAKILGLIAIWTRKSRLVAEWAYAGFFFNFLLAISSHVMANDGEFVPASVALVLLLLSYIYSKKVFVEPGQ